MLGKGWFAVVFQMDMIISFRLLPDIVRKLDKPV